MEGRLPATLDAHGVWRFNPDTIDRLAEELGIGEGSPNGSSARMAKHAEDTLLTVVASNLENNHRLFETLFKVVDRAHSYIEKLEDRLQVQRDAETVSEMLKYQREREQADRASTERTRDKAIDGITRLAGPILMNRLAKHFGVPSSSAPSSSPPETNGTAHANGVPDDVKVRLADQMLGMLYTLDDGTIEKLSTALPAEQFQMLAALRNAVRP